MSQLLSVVVPVFNESAVLEEFHRQMSEVMRATGCDYEMLYIDDGSSDDSAARLSAIRQGDQRVAVIELSRNFGKEVALSAGLDHARGAAVIIIDADLQDPPELVHSFLREWRSGYDVVYGRRSDRRGDSRMKKFTAKWFYRILNRLSNVEIPADAGDFRLLSRRAVDALTALPERHRYMKGLYAWVGFEQKAVDYVRQPRQAGHTKWSYWRLWNFALEGITSFSEVPLKIATYLGLLTSVVALTYGTFLLVRTVLWGNPVPGYPSLIIAVLFLGGVQLVCLGIIGEYLARTYQETKARTLYLVKGYHPTGGGVAAHDGE
ncbi:MAG: glycosyltransferase family 2 protein [Halioglobus sp.]|nr:glycosyltransferase family 2 protein [Halioglobus sp.]